MCWQVCHAITLVDAIAPTPCGVVAQPLFGTAHSPVRVTWIVPRSKSAISDLLHSPGLVPDLHVTEQACRHGLGMLHRLPQISAVSALGRSFRPPFRLRFVALCLVA